MEQSIYAFIRRYSWRQQLVILTLTAVLLPLNYVSLELPKIIINRALGSSAPDFMGMTFERLDLLWLLSGLFLLTVLVSGGVKYVVNLYAGIVSERMLRRLRYQLYNHILRFPLPHFRRVSQGELVQMINAETEALGGFVGEAVSTPGLQGGLLLTSLVFIFVQDPVLGFAAIALYPLQIYLIPKLQAQVNQLGKERVRQVRRNAERISETVTGIRDVHANGGSRWEQAVFSSQLGEVFWIRFDIYKKKYLIKFLNNFINQLGPFFFFSLGGYLVLQGNITLGALVAVINAQKDIASPWKELLTFYQTLYDVKIKYEQTVTQFLMPGLAPQAAIEEDNGAEPDLRGRLRAIHLTLREETGATLLDDVSLETPLPKHIGILGSAGSGKEELALVMAGLIRPQSGRLVIGDTEIARLPEPVRGRGIVYVGNPSFIFGGTIADNLVYGLKAKPVAEPDLPPEAREKWRRRRLEALRSGNSPFDPLADWVDFSGLGIRTAEERRGAMLRALDIAMLTGDIYQLGLRSVAPIEADGTLIAGILEARQAMQGRLDESPDLRRLVEGFDPERYNTNASVAENLLFGSPVGDTFELENISRHPYVLETLRATNLMGELKRVGFRLAQTMVELFADLPPDHEYFRQFSFIAAEDLPDYRTLVSRADPDRLDELGRSDQERLLALPFKLVATRHRLGLIDEPFQDKILEARRYFKANLPRHLAAAIDFFDPARFNRASTLQENILFGKLAYGQAQAPRKIGALIDGLVADLQLAPAITEVGLGSPAGFGGSRLSHAQRQKLAIARAILKQPEILVLDDAATGLDAAEQMRVRDQILAEFADRTVVWVLPHQDWASRFELVLLLEHGRLVACGSFEEVMGRDEPASEAMAVAS